MKNSFVSKDASLKLTSWMLRSLVLTQSMHLAFGNGVPFTDQPIQESETCITLILFQTPQGNSFKTWWTSGSYQPDAP